MRQGRAVYTFADGSVEESSYSEGEQTGPAKFTWANGAVREGNKVQSFGDSFHNNSESERAPSRTFFLTEPFSAFKLNSTDPSIICSDDLYVRLLCNYV